MVRQSQTNLYKPHLTARDIFYQEGLEYIKAVQEQIKVISLVGFCPCFLPKGMSATFLHCVPRSPGLSFHVPMLLLTFSTSSCCLLLELFLSKAKYRDSYVHNFRLVVLSAKKNQNKGRI